MAPTATSDNKKRIMNVQDAVYSPSGDVTFRTGSGIPIVENVTCVWNQNCSLPCPYKGEIKEAHWLREDDLQFPVTVYPQNRQDHIRGEFRGICSLSLDRPEDGAALLLSGVQKQHEGVYRCYVKSSSGATTRRRVRLSVHHLDVSVLEDLQKCLQCKDSVNFSACSFSSFDPTKEYLCTPSVDREKLETYLTAPQNLHCKPKSSVSRISSVVAFSSVPLDPTKEYTCTVSTPYSWNWDTFKPESVTNGFNLNYLYLLLLLTIPVVAFLIYCGRKKDKDPGASNRLKRKEQNGHANGQSQALLPANGTVVNGEMETSFR